MSSPGNPFSGQILLCLVQVKAALQQGYEDDVDPPLSKLAQYIKDELTHEGYKHMMAVGG